LDIVEWFDKDESRQMRNSPSTLQLFWLGRKLFGGRFIRFMSGPKHESDIKNNSNAMLFKGNFPSCTNLRNFNSLSFFPTSESLSRTSWKTSITEASSFGSTSKGKRKRGLTLTLYKNPFRYRLPVSAPRKRTKTNSSTPHLKSPSTRTPSLSWFIFVKPFYNVQKQLKCNVIQREFSILY
jgi:hypothetical protein